MRDQTNCQRSSPTWATNSSWGKSPSMVPEWGRRLVCTCCRRVPQRAVIWPHGRIKILLGATHCQSIESARDVLGRVKDLLFVAPVHESTEYWLRRFCSLSSSYRPLILRSEVSHSFTDVGYLLQIFDCECEIKKDFLLRGPLQMTSWVVPVPPRGLGTTYQSFLLQEHCSCYDGCLSSWIKRQLPEKSDDYE